MSLTIRSTSFAQNLDYALSPPTQEAAKITNVIENDRKYGLFKWRPSYLQWLNAPRYFLTLFCLQIFLQASSAAFTNQQLQELLKRTFLFPQQKILNILSFGEIGTIVLGIPFTYLAGFGNKPRWLTFFTICIIAGLLIISISVDISSVISQSENESQNHFCKDDVFEKEENVFNNGEIDLKSDKTHAEDETNYYYIYLIIFSYGFMRMCETLFWVVGATYLDDNIKRNDTTVYMSISLAARTLGSLAGFSLKSVMKFNLGYSSFDENAMIGWNVGCIVIIFIVLVTAPFILAFPRSIVKQKIRPVFHLQNEDGEISAIEITKRIEKLSLLYTLTSNLKGFFGKMWKLLRNYSLVLIILSNSFAIFASSGYLLWLPKYLQINFRVDKEESTVYTGIATTSSIILGILGTGLFIKQLKLSAKILALMMAMCKLSFAAALTSMMFLTCNLESDLPGKFGITTGVLDPNFGCASQCNCDLHFNPICINYLSDSQSFLSPCHAGCYQRETTTDYYSDSSFNIFNCSCATDSSIVSIGFCKSTCSKFTVYNMVTVITTSLIAIGSVGAIILAIRSVSKEQKTLALGIKSSFASIAILLAPIIYGTIDASSCLVWVNNVKESCAIYDSQKFGYRFHFITSIAFVLAFACDILLTIRTSKMKIFIPFGHHSTSNSSSKPSISFRESVSVTVNNFYKEHFPTSHSK